MSSNFDENERIKKLKSLRQAQKRENTAEALFEKITAGDRYALSKAITLVESQKDEDRIQGQKLIDLCLPHTGKSIRVGVTGVPGVGKSTFIEAFGQHVIAAGHQLAVLAIDPSSEKSAGAILGDKTRMEALSTHEKAFIRPTSAGQTLGGVARTTRESILLCEAAGFDVIMIETVGVGQSEITVHAMVDFFLLLMLSGAGDELQGIKRGIMEMADALVITKCDGDNVKAANRARQEYQNAMHLFPPNSNGWTPKALTSSALERRGLDKVWDTITQFKSQMIENGYLESHRNDQKKYWLHQTIEEALIRKFYKNKTIQSSITAIEKDLKEKEINPFAVAEELLKKVKYE